MRALLNTLFVTSEDIYLALDGENITANRGGETVARYPLHTLQSIVSFSYAGASPALMGACAQRGIGLAFCTPNGRFLLCACRDADTIQVFAIDPDTGMLSDTSHDIHVPHPVCIAIGSK